MSWRVKHAWAGFAAAVLIFCAGLAPAADTGSATGLPIPRFVSLKAASANIRRGPSLTHRVDWVFQHQGMPLIVTGEYGHWRRVMDRDGLGGWIHYALLSGNRSVIIDHNMAVIRARPEPDAPVRAEAERGVIARLDECDSGWCRVSAGGQRGWVEQAGLWGVDLPAASDAPAAETSAAVTQ